MIDQESGELAALVRQQKSLREIIESISSELELRPLLTRLVRSACELIGAERGSIGLVDETGTLVRTEAIYRMPEDELGAESPAGIGLAGYLLEHQCPVLLHRYGDLLHPLQPDMLEDAVIGVPIISQGRMVGFCGIGASPPHRFSEQDVETLVLLARHMAIAIENARRYEEERRRTRRIELIARIGQQIASRLDPEELLDATVRALHEQLDYHHVALFLLDPADPAWLVLRARASRWPRRTSGEYRQSIAVGILGAAARHRGPELVNEVRADPRYVPVPGADTLRAELAVPLLLDQRLLGVLDVASVQPFQYDDVTAIQIVADQLAVALDHASLFTRTQRTLAETRLLYETALRIAAATDVEGVIAAYLEQVAARGRYACTIVLYEMDEAGSRVARISQGRWVPGEGWVQMKEREGYGPDALDPLLDRGETICISDVERDERVPVALRDRQRQVGRPALAMIPLMARGQRIGLVVLSDGACRDWSGSDLWLYQATAAQLATAIESRRQHQLLMEWGRQIAVLQERQRLARELHDSVTQLLFSMTLVAQSISPAWRRNPAEGEQRVDRLLALGQSALLEMRGLLAELQLPQGEERPAGTSRLGPEGLAGALRDYAASLPTVGLQVDIDLPDSAALSPRLQEGLYRIAQEAIHNVIKHSGAREARIRLRVEASVARLTITDDGVGFVAEGRRGEGAGQERGYGMGLQNMHQRARELGGMLRLRTSPGQGTEIEVTVPGPGH